MHFNAWKTGDMDIRRMTQINPII